MKLQKLQKKMMKNVLQNNNYTYIMGKILKTILKNKVYLLIVIVFVIVMVYTNIQMNKRENFNASDIWTLFDNEEPKPDEEEDTCSDE